jgi:hypothetical protein
LPQFYEKEIVMVGTKWFVVSGALVALMVSVSVVRSEEKAAAPSAADKEQMMKMMMEMGKPGPEHERLKAYVGDWDADCAFNCPLDNSVQKTKGVMHIKPLLGDRYIQLNYEGEMMLPDGKTTMPFKGMGIGGYDKGKKKYTNVWIDEMSTTMMLTEGTADGNTITFEGGFTDPMSGKVTKVKEIVTETDSSHHKYELHMEGPETGGKMMKVMEINYTKRA